MKYTQGFIDKHRDINTDYDWWDSTYDDFAQICDILGISLHKNEPSFTGFWSQGDGASWTGDYQAQGSAGPTYDTAPVKIREHAPKDETLHEIADELCLLARIHRPVYADVTRLSSHYAHSHTMVVNHWNYHYDEVDLDSAEVDSAIYLHIEETLTTQFRALADWLYAALEAEHTYLTSDEAVIETLEANEIEEHCDA